MNNNRRPLKTNFKERIILLIFKLNLIHGYVYISAQVRTRQPARTTRILRMDASPILLTIITGGLSAKFKARLQCKWLVFTSVLINLNVSYVRSCNLFYIGEIKNKIQKNKICDSIHCLPSSLSVNNQDWQVLAALISWWREVLWLKNAHQRASI